MYTSVSISMFAGAAIWGIGQTPCSFERYLVTIIIAIIIILLLADKDTRCTTNLSTSGSVQEYDVITVTCSITYSGNWAPVMRWFNSATRHNFTDVITDHQATTTMMTSQLTVAASADLNGSKIACVTYFIQPRTSLPVNASANVPSYTYTWMSRSLNVVLRCK